MSPSTLMAGTSGNQVAGVPEPGAGEIICHRGLHDEATENSVASIREGYRDGFRCFELDVHQTADGVPVLGHAGWYRRGQGFPRAVGSLRYQNIASETALGGGEKYPRLEDAYEYSASQGGGRFFLDVKGGGGYAGLEDRLLALATRHASLVETAFLSFTDGVLGRLLGAGCPWPTYRLLMMPRGFLSGCQRWPSGLAGVGIWHRTANAQTVRCFGDQGLRTLLWVVNDRKDMRRFQGCDVAGWITDRPNALRAGLAWKAEESVSITPKSRRFFFQK